MKAFNKNLAHEVSRISTSKYTIIVLMWPLRYIYNMIKTSVQIAYMFGLIIVFVLGCKEQVENEVIATQEEPQEIRILQKDVDTIQYQEYALDEAALKEAADWKGFQELASSVEYLKKADLTFFKGDLETVKEALKKCEFNVSKPFYTESIMARLVVVETKFLILQNSLTLDNITKEEQLQGIKEVFIAWNNLIYVINKKFEFESTNVERPE